MPRFGPMAGSQSRDISPLLIVALVAAPVLLVGACVVGTALVFRLDGDLE